MRKHRVDGKLAAAGWPLASDARSRAGADKETLGFAPPVVDAGLVEALTGAYETLIKRQRTASAAFVRWSSPHRRAHEFAWVDAGEETLISSGRELRVPSSSPIYDALNKMMATIELNPYERELLYGYPYVIGHRDGKPIRAPVLTIPVSINAVSGELVIRPEDELVRFNSLPYRSEFDSAAHELALARLIEATPEYPVSPAALASFCAELARQMKVETRGQLDGRLDEPPGQPRSGSWLALVDHAACFVAPKTSYFVASDLREIGSAGGDTVATTALGVLIGERGNEPTSDVFGDSRNVFFPFISNPSQRRVAHLVDEPSNRIIVVEGPPGTGKSLTIANVAAHLVAKGNRVLISSQKDQALHVVDDLLRQLGMPQLPMTLLRQDRESKKELRERLAAIEKTRAAQETERELTREVAEHERLAQASTAVDEELTEALVVEHVIVEAEKRLGETQTMLQRWGARRNLRRAHKAANRRAPRASDAVGDETTAMRRQLLLQSLSLLEVSAEHRVGEASRNARNEIAAFSKLLGRNQSSYRNFSIFDRMKGEPDRCQMLLSILPCWIMTPDDVARLFPCQPGLFDVVIVDEASQCDLPSMTPILYRAKQAIIAGDSNQMQARRFAFTSEQVAIQAWHEWGVSRFDPDRWLDPTKIDLLELTSIRKDEEVFLDEHFRSLPPIIAFSNERWYGDRLRVMRDLDDQRFGEPGAPTIQMHRIEEGRVNPGTQENHAEARALVARLKEHLSDPGYAGASFGAICLFEEQMRLLSDLVAEEIDEDERIAHDLVVVNPDGFQGDERDVIYYSLSYDADGMGQAALSARQADYKHVQGMLNVAFTRGRDELHVFHSAPVEEFGMASGRGAIRDWLEHCRASQEAVGTIPHASGVARTDSEFEAQVLQALAACGIEGIAQYPSCGFFIDIVARQDSSRVAIECDGEIWHLDEHGELRPEDVVRQEILERAGWTVLRIPYRRWLTDPDEQIARVVSALAEAEKEEEEVELVATATNAQLAVSSYEAAVVTALKAGNRDHEAVLRAARAELGFARLGSRVRWSIEQAVKALERRKLVVVEDGELFLNEEGRSAVLPAIPKRGVTAALPRRRSRRRYRRYY